MYTPVYNVVGGGISQVYVLRVHVRCSFISYDTSGQSAVGRTRNERGVAKSRPDSGRRFRPRDVVVVPTYLIRPPSSLPRRRHLPDCNRVAAAAGGRNNSARRAAFVTVSAPRPQPPVAAAPAPTRRRTSPLPLRRNAPRRRPRVLRTASIVIDPTRVALRPPATGRVEINANYRPTCFGLSRVGA